jgi:hypothetical protein
MKNARYKNGGKMTAEQYDQLKPLTALKVNRSVLKKATGWSTQTIRLVSLSKDFEDYCTIRDRYLKPHKQEETIQDVQQQVDMLQELTNEHAPSELSLLHSIDDKLGQLVELASKKRGLFS